LPNLKRRLLYTGIGSDPFDLEPEPVI